MNFLYPKLVFKKFNFFNNILDTSETVDLGGLFLKIPSLELLFAEKIFLGNSEAEMIGGRGYDDIELLAKTYSLDREKIDEYHRSTYKKYDQRSSGEI